VGGNFETTGIGVQNVGVGGGKLNSNKRDFWRGDQGI
jgi:hypothetical protein